MSLRILYWNTGGLNDTKFTQFRRNACNADTDIYFIVEAGAVTEANEFYQTSGYVSHILN